MVSDAYRHAGELPPELRFLAGGGEATRLILERDWAGHVLGPPAAWSDAFKATLSTVLNSPESMILAWGREELNFFFNEAYFPLLGPRLATAMGAPFRQVWADAWVQAKPIIDDAFAGRSQRFDDLPWKLGADRGAADTWWTFSYSRVLDARGEVAGLFIFTNETTARVLSDVALRQSEERLRLVVEGATDYAILTTDPAGTITTWSRGAEEVMGWTADEAVGRSASLIFTPEDRRAGVDVRELLKARASGCANDERWHLTKSGARVFMNGSVHPLPPDAQGAERGFIKIARDETERWEARRALETLNQTLEQQVAERTEDRDRLWRLSTDIMLVAGLDGAIEAVNPAWTRVLGWTETDLVGRPSIDFVHPDDVARTKEASAAIRRGEMLARFENRYRHKEGGYRDIAWAAGPGDGKVVAVGRDATEAKAQATALQAAQEQLAQSQKMEAVGQLTGGLAHDFNNLLAGIAGSLELMSARLAQGRVDEVGKYMAAAQGAAKRAAALTHRLLAFSRRQTLAPTPVDVNRLAAGMIDLIQRTVGPAVQVEHVGAAGLWTALVDASQLENALLNLCINARDAMPDGGRITIETANRWIDKHTGRERDMPEGQYLSLCVSDSGVGMAPETVAKAFDPFFTTKPIGQGTGLGLSMIYGFAKQSGGQTRIYSEPGQGTSVCIYLPRHRGEAEPDGVGAAPTHMSFADAGETVLVVDDEPTVRMLVTDVLGDLGYMAIEAADSTAGLEVLRSNARIDLLVTDIGLPGGMNGRQMADAARAGRPALKVLFITGYAENALLSNNQLEPGTAVLTKPFAVDALAAKVRELISASPDRRADA